MIKLSDQKDNSSLNTGAVVLEKEPEVKEPPLYQVVLINDDYTPMEFVVFVLQTVFGHPHEKATQIMMAVHNKGKGVCGIFSKEIPRLETLLDKETKIFKKLFSELKKMNKIPIIIVKYKAKYKSSLR